MKYHPCAIRFLTPSREAGRGTVLGGQFDWGGLLLKGNVWFSETRNWKLEGSLPGAVLTRCLNPAVCWEVRVSGGMCLMVRDNPTGADNQQETVNEPHIHVGTRA